MPYHRLIGFHGTVFYQQRAEPDFNHCKVAVGFHVALLSIGWANCRGDTCFQYATPGRL
jgi:hypothetical protein